MISTGDKLGRYKIRSTIGKGGMGEVWLADDTELERLVALKVLPKDLANDAERMRRFIQDPFYCPIVSQVVSYQILSLKPCL